ncbi:hypothetical protein C8A05DRAFT_17748 [Staphylotrichum tortipilum]|uniref:D-xylose 1-dehydrogenase (NADP(+), D-xylono-1,5-lactone-forming) n=1 Tax=Staphylotrichum tortipilum TaxID=2831512 RepID=A0AAN6MFH3_9PEZI|nr:hypothetical protein C8A05DRAFT_17748 [Staphylotrichum longicolle]
MASVVGFVRRVRQVASPPSPPKAPDALKFGILGAANIAPAALIGPARSHPEVIVQAVAARSKDKAEAYAKKHGIPQVFDDYQALLDDPAIDAVYIPLPNGLHYEWAHKALAAGKHVLLEKPSVSNAAEAEHLFLSPPSPPTGTTRPVLLEAFHYRFHPAWRHFLSLLSPPDIAHALSTAVIPGTLIFGKDDIRFQYPLAGGAMMDLGTYPLSSLREVFAAAPEECLASAVETCPPPNEKCDASFEVSFRFPNGGVGEVRGSLAVPLWKFAIPRLEVTHKGVVVPDTELPDGQEKVRVRKVAMANFMMPTLWHRIDVEDEWVVRVKGGGGAEGEEVVKKWTTRESKKVYNPREDGRDAPGEDWWLTYRYQLEEFVNRVRGRPGSGAWVSGEDSVAQMRMLDQAYLKAGLPLRPTTFTAPAEGTQ